MKSIIHPGLEIQMPLKLCSVLCRQCESSLSTYAPHHGSVYSLLRPSFYSSPSTALLRLQLQVSLFSLCRASCLISVANLWNIHPRLSNYLTLVWIIYDNTCRRFQSTQLLHKEYDLSLDLLIINISTQELL